MKRVLDFARFTLQVMRLAGSPLGALGNLGAWFYVMARSRLPKLPRRRFYIHAGQARVCVETVPDVNVVHELLVRGEYDDLVLPPTARTVVDIGANIGVASVQFRARYPDARIVACEPDPATYAKLECTLSHDPKAQPANVAVAASDGERILFSSLHGVVNSFTRTLPEQTEVPVRTSTLASVFRDHGLDHVDLLKVDVEGAETEVFADPAPLANVEAIVGEIHETLIGQDAVSFCAERLPGFDVQVVDRPGGDPDVRLFYARRSRG